MAHAPIHGVGSYRFVIRAVLWVIYLAVVASLIVWWVKT
jgi:hypothetical protein